MTVFVCRWAHPLHDDALHYICVKNKPVRHLDQCWSLFYTNTDFGLTWIQQAIIKHVFFNETWEHLGSGKTRAYSMLAVTGGQPLFFFPLAMLIQLQFNFIYIAVTAASQGFILQGKSNAAGVSNIRPGVQYCPDKDYNLAKIWMRAYIFRLLTVFFFLLLIW